MLRNVKAHHDGDERAAFESDDPGDVRVDLHRDLRPVFRLACDHPLFEGLSGERGDAFRPAEKSDERGDIVGPHVEERPAAGVVVEFGIGVPALVAPAHHYRDSCDRSADESYLVPPLSGCDIVR